MRASTNKVEGQVHPYADLNAVPKDLSGEEGAGRARQ